MCVCVYVCMYGSSLCGSTIHFTNNIVLVCVCVLPLVFEKNLQTHEHMVEEYQNEKLESVTYEILPTWHH